MGDDGLVLNLGEPTSETSGSENVVKRRLGFYEAKKRRIAEKKTRGKQSPSLGSRGNAGARKIKPASSGASKLTLPQATASIGNGEKSCQFAANTNPGGSHQAGAGADDMENVDDVMAAVQIALSRDQAFEEDLLHEQKMSMNKGTALDDASEEHISNEESNKQGATNTVDFMTQQQYEAATIKHSKRKRRLVDNADDLAVDKGQSATQSSQGKQGIASTRNALGVQQGHLMHNAHNLGDDDRKDLFGDIDSSSFRSLALAESLCSHLDDINFSLPTKTQVASIPWLLKGRDALINAPTGSGKTLAFLAPIVHSLQEQSERLHRSLGTHAIIIAPTRELVVQINDVLMMILRRYHWLVGGMLMGGEQRTKEKARLRKGVMVLTATPGRLLDHLQNTESFRTTELKWLVMDEADRLLDLGFEKKMEEILSIIDKRLEQARTGPRQTVLMSATMHSNLTRLATLSLQQPVMIGFRGDHSAGDVQEGKTKLEPGEMDSGDQDGQNNTADEEHQMFRIPKTLKQSFMEVPCKLRSVALLAYISAKFSQGKKSKMVVFLSSCDTVDFAHELVSQLFPVLLGPESVPSNVLKLHGNMVQGERFESFLKFQKHDNAILICTDVAARGLDFPEVSCIIQFESPGPVAEYVHRVGRTARMGRKGEAMLFLLPSELEYSRLLENQGLVVQNEDLLQYLELLPVPPDFVPPKRPGRAVPVENFPLALVLQQRLMAAVASSSLHLEMAKNAFRTFLRAYSTHPRDLKPIFHPKRLHLGHLAQSFCLKDTPTMVGHAASKAEKTRRKTSAASNKRQRPQGKGKPGQPGSRPKLPKTA